MNLVFFDIECASVNKTTAKICAFGYVICDESFNIIKKEDILVNPRGGFHLTDRKGDKGIVLPYAYDEFKKYPSFPKVYNYIKDLLEDENNVVLGHATMNDVNYLNLETRRFKLPSFKFSFSDSQLIYMTYIGDFSRQFGLEHIANALGVEFTPHRAADDAYATMRIVEAMCREKNCTYNELAAQLKMKDGKIKKYVITAPVSESFAAYNRAQSKEKRRRELARTEFYDYVSRKRVKRGGKFSGKAFTFSRDIEIDCSLSKKLADEIYARGGKYSRHLTHSDYYIAERDDESARTQSAKKKENITITDVNGLKAMLNG